MFPMTRRPPPPRGDQGRELVVQQHDLRHHRPGCRTARTHHDADVGVFQASSLTPSPVIATDVLSRLQRAPSPRYGPAHPAEVVFWPWHGQSHRCRRQVPGVHRFALGPSVPATAATDTALSPEITFDLHLLRSLKYSRVSRASGRTAVGGTTRAAGVKGLARQERRPPRHLWPAAGHATAGPDILGLPGGVRVRMEQDIGCADHPIALFAKRTHHSIWWPT